MSCFLNGIFFSVFVVVNVKRIVTGDSGDVKKKNLKRDYGVFGV